MKSLSMASGFSFDRFKQVIRRFLILNKKSYALAFCGVLFGLIAFWLFLMLVASDIPPQGIESIPFALGVMIYFIGGAFLSSAIFNELQSSGSASHFLTLPATTLEKLFAAWTVSYVFYTAASFIVLGLLLIFTSFATSVIFGVENPGSLGLQMADPINFALTYMIFNSIFLLGAVYFRGKNFLKTALSIVLTAFITFSLFILIINITGLTSFEVTFSSFLFFTSQNRLLVLLSQLLTYVPISGLFILVGYFQLKNRQVA